MLTTFELALYVACAVGGRVGGVARFGVRVDGVLDEEDGKRAHVNSKHSERGVFFI